jgi:hypothetical protein
LEFVDGITDKELSRSVTLQGQAVVDLSFFLPPVNVKLGKAGIDTVPVSWDKVDTGGGGITYKVYCSGENKPDSARLYKSDLSETNITLINLPYYETCYVWVSMVEGGTESDKSAVASAALRETMLGKRGPAGGIIFYDKGKYTDGWQYLECAPASAEFRAAWDDAMSKSKNLVNGGFTDWRLPTKDELNLLYVNLKQHGLGDFKNEWYWSSSQGNSGYAWLQSFDSGNHYNGYKHDYYVRCVRAF